jgi:hypothetical protein
VAFISWSRHGQVYFFGDALMSGDVDYNWPIGNEDKNIGYICSGCGIWVNGGDYHICPKYNNKSNIIDCLEKISEQLERITDLLVAINEA